jgi:transposase
MILAAQLEAMQTMISLLKKWIVAQHRSNQDSKRLETFPGIGVIGATAIAATVTDPAAFPSGRDFAAWIGLVPRQDSTGGKPRLGQSRSRATGTCGGSSVRVDAMMSVVRGGAAPRRGGLIRR